MPTKSSAEEKLQLSELRYRRLFESAQDGILILDAQSGKVSDANPFLKQILGYTQKELLGKQLWQIGVFKDIAASQAAFQQLQVDGYIRYKDLPLQTKNGKTIDVEFVSNVYVVNKEKLIQCNIRDITDRRKIEKLAEDRARELEHLTRSQEETKYAMLNVMEDLEEAKTLIEIEKVKDEAMLASIGEGLIAVNTDKKIMIMNKAAEKMLGWKTKELLGKEVSELPLVNEAGHLVPINERPTHIALSTGKTTNNTLFFMRRNKTKFPIAINVTPIKLDGRIIGAIDIFRDITEEKAIDRAKNEFVSLASHQLRTPLGIAKWYLEAIHEDTYLKKAPQITKDYLNEIYKSNERLLALVRNLLSVSRIDQREIKNTPQKIKIAQLIKAVIKEMSIIASKNKISLHLKMNIPKLLNMFIDPLRVQEVIENIITNAITYSSRSGVVEILVSYDKMKKNVLIAIHDSGIGISESDKRMLFTKFFRSEKAIARNTEGSGLGLYVVKSYVEEWGGTISVESQEDHGSTFTIALPIDKRRR